MLDKDAVEAQHGAVCIDADTSAGQAARMQPLHAIERERIRREGSGGHIEQKENIVKQNPSQRPSIRAARQP